MGKRRVFLEFNRNTTIERITLVANNRTNKTDVSGKRLKCREKNKAESKSVEKNNSLLNVFLYLKTEYA